MTTTETNTTPPAAPNPSQFDLKTDPPAGTPAPDLKKELEEEKNKSQKYLEELVTLKAKATPQPDPAPMLQDPQLGTPPKPQDLSLDDVWYSNPTKAMEMVEQRVEAKIEKKYAAKQQVQDFFSEFYRENPDLKDSDRLVQLIRHEKAPEISQLKTKKDVSDFLSKEARSIIGGIRGKNAPTSETRLESREAVNLEGSQNPLGGQSSSSQPQQPISFTEQLRRLRRRGK